MGGARNDLNEKNFQTILIIKDTPEDNEVLSSILENDYHLIFATNLEEVLEIIGQYDIDLVLLDNDTPNVKAGGIFFHLKANVVNRNTPIILIVRSEKEGNLVDLQTGVADWIVKPLQPPIVIARLQRHLELKRYRDLWGKDTPDGYDIVVGNQWEFDFLLGREWQRALRNQTPLSLVLIDIDFFEKLVSNGGGMASNDYLRLVGETLRTCVKRDLDFIARPKKHTFACLLPDTDTDGAYRVSQLIREKVAKLNIPNPCSPIAGRVTLSIGVATVRPTLKLNQEYLLHQAEDLLKSSSTTDRTQLRSKRL